MAQLVTAGATCLTQCLLRFVHTVQLCVCFESQEKQRDFENEQ